MADDSELKSEGVSDQELVKILKRRFENWREILIHGEELLTWKKPFSPFIIMGSVSFIYLLLWYLSLSVLTTLSIFGIIICVLDYAVPLLSASIFDANKWTGPQEKKYEEICHNLVNIMRDIKHVWHSIHQFKETKPYLYFIAIIGSLLFFAWFGNLIDNSLIIYSFVLNTSMYPGLYAQPLIREKIDMVMGMICGSSGQSKKKK